MFSKAVQTLGIDGVLKGITCWQNCVVVWVSLLLLGSYAQFIQSPYRDFCAACPALFLSVGVVLYTFSTGLITKVSLFKRSSYYYGA